MTITVKEVQGDFFSNNAELIIHGCNDMGVMGAGIAVPIKQQYPLNFVAYEQECKDGIELGKVVFNNEDGGPVIANAITQHLGKLTENGLPISYAAIETCFERVKEYCMANDIKTVALPRIGAGLGGGNWDLILGILKKVFVNQEFDIDVVVYYL